MGDSAPHVLVVDDDPRIRTMLERYLEGEGLTVTLAESGTAMRKAMSATSVDVVLLDLVLPGEDGLSIARDLRAAHPDLGIIMLTGRSDVIDRVVGLEVGADDYIAKPFHLREVLARIRTVLRRLHATVPSVEQRPADHERVLLRFDGWTLDCLKRELRSPAGEAVPLTSGEYDLLLAFVEHPNRVLDRDRLMDLAKGRDWSAYDRTIDTQVSRLRRKIEADPSRPNLIKSVRGAGYLFAGEVVREDGR